MNRSRWPCARPRPAPRSGEICRKLGVSDQSFYRWKKRFGALGVSELHQLRDENRKLKGLVADLSLDKTILHEALIKIW